jgi:hypothetical protein
MLSNVQKKLGDIGAFNEQVFSAEVFSTKKPSIPGRIIPSVARPSPL